MWANLLVDRGKILYQEVETPRARRGEVLIRIQAALTCGTDLKAYLRGHPKMPMPTLFGHEFSGEIAAMGSGVNGFREGDAVMAVHTAPCGSCYYCMRDQENLCPAVLRGMVLGAYAEYVCLPAPVIRANLFPKPRHLSFAEAALLEPLACVVHSIEQVRLRPDDTVLIVGAGAIGLLHLLVLRAQGVEKVVVAGRRAHRLRTALALGATAVVDGSPELVRDQVSAITQGRGADVVIECTGQPEVWEEAPQYARRGGTLVLFGGCPSGTRVGFDAGRLHYDQLALVSPFHFRRRDVRQAYELLASGKVEGSRLISGTYPLSRLDEVFSLLQTADCIKYAMVP